jgi:hypothetical protein
MMQENVYVPDDGSLIRFTEVRFTCLNLIMIGRCKHVTVLTHSVHSTLLLLLLLCVCAAVQVSLIIKANIHQNEGF